MIVKYSGDYKWENVSILNYKETGTNFKDITRQVLFDGLGDIPCQLRYFEVQSGGYSSLERHEHVHVVLILRGAGQVFLGDAIHTIVENDVITIPPKTWHQFQATTETPLGFLCLVNVERDKVQLPTVDDLVELKKNAAIAAFIKN
jgi:quercetin dioxygenase-like cupin family protein